MLRMVVCWFMLILIFPVRISPRNFSIDAMSRRGTMQFPISKRPIGSTVSVAIRGVTVAGSALILRRSGYARRQAPLGCDLGPGGGWGSLNAEIALYGDMSPLASGFRRRLRPGLPASEAMSALTPITSALLPKADVPVAATDFRV